MINSNRPRQQDNLDPRYLWRARRYDNHQWEYGNLIYLDEEYAYICPPYNQASSLSPLDIIKFSSILINSHTIGKCTGVVDTNGYYIFEGDVIHLGGFTQRYMDVRWNEESLAWELTDINTPNHEVNHLYNTLDLAELNVEAAYGEIRSEIVGNIHENTEYAIPKPAESNMPYEF